MPDLGIILTPIFCCHPEVGKALEALETLDALCFREKLDPLDLHRVVLYRWYMEIHHSHITQLKSGARVAFNICT